MDINGSAMNGTSTKLKPSDRRLESIGDKLKKWRISTEFWDRNNLDQSSRSFGWFAIYLVSIFIIIHDISYLVNPGRFFKDLVENLWRLEVLVAKVLPSFIFNCIGLAVQRNILNKFRFSRIIKPLEVGFLLNFVILPWTLLPINRGLTRHVQLIIILEQLRFLAKFWSMFIETQFNREAIPTIKEAITFIFSPTLIYRKVYKKRTNIRRESLFKGMINLILGLRAVFLIVDRYWVPARDKLTSEEISPQDAPNKALIVYILATHISILLYYQFFYFGLQSVFTEILCHQELSLIQDCWNAETIAQLISKQNVILHLFIKRYLYQPIRRVTSSDLTLFTIHLGSGLAVDFLLYLFHQDFQAFFTALMIVLAVASFATKRKVYQPIPRVLIFIIFSYSCLTIFNFWTVLAIFKNILKH